MNEIRSFASLSGSLLARKGGARPAMRPQTMSNLANLDDLGWDDMGAHDMQADEHVPSSIAALTPAPKPVPPREDDVHAQQRALTDHFQPVAAVHEAEPAEPEAAPVAAPVAVRAVPAKAKRKPAAEPRAEGRKAAFTLRLDADRHLRLRLASAVSGQSSQQLVTAALDAFLDTLPEIGSFARKLPRTSTN